VTIEKLRSGSVRDVDQIASFVFGMSRSMVKDQKRLEWRREKLREAFMRPEMVQAPVGDASLDVDCLERCLARLAERERMVVLLTFYAERTAGEVARELALREGNVRVIRHRAVERLRACMTSGEVAQ
jgi:RNA polymerase sigma-70 factor (ECF subfamily)